MKIIFDENGIKYNEQTVTYDQLKKENANSYIFKILAFCIKNEENIEFECTEKCTPFGRKMMEMLKKEFSEEPESI